MGNLMRLFQPPLTLCLLILVLAPVYGQQKRGVQRAINTPVKTVFIQSGLILKDIPGDIDVKGRYLFYLHGLIVENEGVRPTSPKFGVYEYKEILETFEKKGFIVISEPRPKGTDPEQYAAKVIEQIKDLIKAGVPPQHIIVVGASL